MRSQFNEKKINLSFIYENPIIFSWMVLLSISFYLMFLKMFVQTLHKPAFFSLSVFVCLIFAGLPGMLWIHCQGLTWQPISESSQYLFFISFCQTTTPDSTWIICMCSSIFFCVYIYNLSMTDASIEDIFFAKVAFSPLPFSLKLWYFLSTLNHL